MIFRNIKIGDKIWIDDIIKGTNSMGSDNAFGTMFIWRKVYKLQICEKGGFLFRKYGNFNQRYAYPIGNGNIKTAVQILINENYLNDKGFQMIGLTEKMVLELEKSFPKYFTFFKKRESADYIYNSDDLLFLKGRKYHAKRNHVSKFKSSYDWSYESITKYNINDCLEVINTWCEKSERCVKDSVNYERCALKSAFDNFSRLGFVGGIVKVDKKPVAFSLGEEINEKTFVVHFEKADIQYAGVYAMINQMFVESELKKYKYINREEDLGIEGLRKSKLSYCPEILLEKYDAMYIKK